MTKDNPMSQTAQAPTHPAAPKPKKSVALSVYATLRSKGTQKPVLDTMQTREDLYRYLGYHDYERKLDALFAKSK
jgi:methylisocitrate lyase